MTAEKQSTSRFYECWLDLREISDAFNTIVIHDPLFLLFALIEELVFLLEIKVANSIYMYTYYSEIQTLKY